MSCALVRGNGARATCVRTRRQLHGQLYRDGSLIRIEIPAECFDEIDDFLRVSGFRAFSFMPDMQGLLREHEYRIEKSMQDVEKFFPDEFKHRT